ncbi:ATP-dependent DNA helicase PIF1 [Elysia marginata]|uniref:ATP-dependent DNA helicase PIF1 n=1 Tax=Elysia marginata TaxID=1093978 RepID=A0AAV4H8W1_9GAST|nr:ATP-dependent DNA helicase PIF1 [Elysia marginata]
MHLDGEVKSKHFVVRVASPTFTIQGKPYHRISNLLPERGAVPKFSQIYFYDLDAQLDYRLLHSGLDPQILRDFQTTLHFVNTYIKSFNTAIEVSAEQSHIKIVLYAEKKTSQNGHARSYNLLTSSEITAHLPGDSTGNLDIILRCREGDGQELKRINTCHRSYDPLHYILMFPTDCDGWHLGLNRTDNKKLTAAGFYKSRLQIRYEDFNIVFKRRKLTQQYAFDQWAKVEAGRLDRVRRNKINTKS